MKAGRELDARVAKEVMGWTTKTAYSSGCEYDAWFMPTGIAGLEWREMYQPPEFSKNIEAAWQVVEKLSGDYKVNLAATTPALKGNRYCCSLTEYGMPYPEWDAYGETAPLAICQVALKITSS